MNNVFTPSLLDKIAPQFQSIIDKFSYKKGLYKYAVKDIRISPPVMPKLWGYIFKHEDIISLDYLIKISKNFWKAEGWEQYKNDIPEITEELVLESRLRNFYAGFLRELHVALTLHKCDPSGIISRSDESDTQSGAWDICYTRSSDSKLFYFAIGHEGRGSDEHYWNRKKNKRDAEVILLQSTDQSRDIHLVPEWVLETYVCGGSKCLNY